MRSTRTVLGTLLGLGLCATVALAHGGVYTGPTGGGTPGYSGPVGGATPGPQPIGPTGPGTTGGTTPPGPGGGTTGPSTGPVGPVRPGPSTRGPSTSRTGSTPGRRKSDSSSLALDWTTWWNLNGDAYLDVKNRMREARPTSVGADDFLGLELPAENVAKVSHSMIRQELLPAVIQGLRDPFADARAGAAIAFGKIATMADGEASGRLRSLLSDPDMVVRESACLALGIHGDPEALPVLLDVARDTPQGRRIVGAGATDVLPRTRSFAAVAVGLIGSRGNVGNEPLTALLDLARSPAVPQEVKVGAAVALQLVRWPEGAPALLQAFKDPELDAYVRTHLGVALGKAGARMAIGELLARLDDQEVPVAHAAAIALGLLVDRDDHAAVTKIMRFASSGPDRGLRNFCLIALGQIGSPKSLALLAGNVTRAAYPDATFSALALGIMGHRRPEIRAETGPILLEAYGRARDLEKAAMAVGLGLLSFEPARSALRADLEAGAGSQTLRGHLCTALGLLGDRAALPVIRDLVRQKGDPDLRKRAAIALGLLKDVDAVPLLRQMILESSASQALLGAVTIALGYVGDRAAVPLLTSMVQDPKHQHDDLARAFAVVALGFLGDKDLIPVLSRIHENANYLAVTGGLAELLSIL